jgi:hypothetical protein
VHQQQSKVSDGVPSLLHTRFLGLELDASLKTQINQSLANALVAIKAADIAPADVAELLNAGISPSSTIRKAPS